MDHGALSADTDRQLEIEVEGNGRRAPPAVEDLRRRARDPPVMTPPPPHPPTPPTPRV